MNFEDHIEEGHVGSTCPFCDAPVGSDEKHKVVIAHECKFIVHADCVDELRAQDD